MKKSKGSISVKQNKTMVVKIQMARFSKTTDLLSAGQCYAQSFEAGMPSTVKNNSDHHKWPDIVDT